MNTALNRCQGRASNPGQMFQRLADEAILSTPLGLSVLQRIDAATDDSYPQRHEHIEKIALVCLRPRTGAELPQ